MKFNLKTALSAFLAASIMTGCSGSSGPELTYLPMKVDKDSKWGMVGPEGKILFEDEFENEPTMAYDGFFNVEENGGISVYAAEEKPRVLGDLEMLKEAGMMSEGLIPVVRPSERITFYTDKGEKAFVLEPYEGKEITSVTPSFQDGMNIFYTEEGMCGAIDTKGEVKIKPIYTHICNFQEGYAYAHKPSENDSIDAYDAEYVTPVYIINKKGEEVAKVEGLIFQSTMYKGRFVATKDERWGFVDKKGEFTKVPAKVKSISNYNDKLFVFSNEEGKEGVMDMEGETVIRPKYETILILESGKFLCISDNKKVYIVNDKDEREATIEDADRAGFLPNFGIIARIDKEYCFIKENGEPVSKNGFYRLGTEVPGSIISDYFDPEAAAKKLVSYVTDQGYGNAKLGDLISNFTDGSPEDYAGTTEYSIPDIEGGYRFSIDAIANSFHNIALSEPIYVEKTSNSYWGTYTYRDFDHYEYSWNPEALCEGISVALSVVADGLYETLKAYVVKDLEAKGYHVDDTSDAYAILSKGDIVTAIMPNNSYDSSSLRLVMFNANVFAEGRSSFIETAQNRYDKIASKQIRKSSDD